MNIHTEPLSEERAEEIASGGRRSTATYTYILTQNLKNLEPGQGVRFGPLDSEKKAKQLRRALGPVTIQLGWFAGYAPPGKADEEAGRDHGRKLSTYHAQIFEATLNDITGWYVDVVRKPQVELED
jgi:hypothetical protein